MNTRSTNTITSILILTSIAATATLILMLTAPHTLMLILIRMLRRLRLKKPWHF